MKEQLIFWLPKRFINNIKTVAFIAKLVSDGQKEEAIEWLKKVSNKNPNQDNRRYAAEALKELGVTEE